MKEIIFHVLIMAVTSLSIVARSPLDQEPGASGDSSGVQAETTGCLEEDL